MPELERALASLAEAIEWPPAPQIAPQVVDRIERRRRRRRSLVVAVASVAVAVVATFAVAPARTAVLRFFHLRGVTIERVETLPSARERFEASDFGRLMPRAVAERVVRFRLVLPPDVHPQRVRVLDGLASIALQRNGVPLVLTEFRGTGQALLKRVAPPATKIEELSVDGAPAFWVSGAEHVLILPGPYGSVRERAVRVGDNVLLWEHGDLTLRLAGAISRNDAVALARSMH